MGPNFYYLSALEYITSSSISLMCPLISSIVQFETSSKSSSEWKCFTAKTNPWIHGLTFRPNFPPPSKSIHLVALSLRGCLTRISPVDVTGVWCTFFILLYFVIEILVSKQCRP